MMTSINDDSDDFGINGKHLKDKVGSTRHIIVNSSDSDDDKIALLKDEEPSLKYGGVPNITCRQNFADCSNVFKAFIGSALIGLPFATLQAGIGFALIGMVFISTLTDHCCLLIVKCKRIVIKNILDAKRAQGVDEERLREESQNLGRELTFGKIGKTCLGTPGIILINTSLMITQFGFCIGYFIFLGNTMRSIIKHYFVINNSTTTMVDAFDQNYDTLKDNSVSILNNSTFSLLSDNLDMSITPKFLNSSLGFAIFLALPLPLLILIAFVRNLRKLGPVSVIANASITFAFAATATFIIASMKSLPKPILWFKTSTFPIFFGQVTSAFEGIGTVIPIEGSMAENRPKYPAFLHISITGLTCILSSFGIIGYLAFGEKTCQIITVNLHGPIAIALQILLFSGVLCTYPLQIYPCIQITESLILKFRRWRIKKNNIRELVYDQEESETLIDNIEHDQQMMNVKMGKWESNVVRTILVLFTAVIALVFRFQFAYIAALTGSIGSSLLSYIIPALCHLRLTKNNRCIRLKDMLLILFGIVGGVCGVTITIRELIESFNGTLPAHC